MSEAPQVSTSGTYSFKAKDLQAQAKQLGDKGPPLSSDEKRRFFYSGKKSTAGILFTSPGDKKWSKIRVLINGCIDTDFGPSCIAKIMGSAREIGHREDRGDARAKEDGLQR
jgi:hypothetical protein